MSLNTLSSGYILVPPARLERAAHGFRIIDSRNPSHRSQLLQGKVLDLSKEGLCIGTSTVQEECHVHHPSLQCKNRLEMEVDLDPCMTPMKTFGEVK